MFRTCIDHAFVRGRCQRSFMSAEEMEERCLECGTKNSTRAVYLRGFRRNGPRQSRLEPNVCLSRAESEDGRCLEAANRNIEPMG
jgi:hypothetical protein